ncbi:phosphoribosylglycinamide formyltransferase [Taibaiella sp. KBW10]|uniref:phosphoribosylglycinamide formyltransferase n=1 Tax=Taibaiella sp. KBW10 TaxID=2153357 RepID=UPI000F5B6CF3|nr:phosphoribosylglycinamide formyltransferase [Taibaiella sp. KBW10]RQO30236.1 phosphoribosylglycinamide formyltransferase [Taibaiella sp. KBW10]
MKNIILFASGAGSNVQAIIDYFEGKNTVKPVAIVCNKPEAGVLQIAQKYQIPVEMIDKQSFSSDEFMNKLNTYSPDLLVLAGFLWKIPAILVQKYPGKIINIHPALLPNFGGKGMYGMHVHNAVIAQKEPESGITIHYVNEHYDEGNIIVQAHCKIEPSDTPEDLAHKIHHLEHFYFPKAIEFLLK